MERTHRRCARHADGWQTSAWDPKDLEFRINDTRKKVAEEGRDPATFETHLYHNINVNEDREKAILESQKFLEDYYVPTKFPRTFVDQWVATGSPRQCADRLRQLRDMGFSEVTLPTRCRRDSLCFEAERSTIPRISSAAPSIIRS